MEKIAVLGAGVMGHGIAQVAAQAGYAVALYDVDEKAAVRGREQIAVNFGKAIEKGKCTAATRDRALGNLTTTTDLGKACADAALVIEAAPEKMALKIELFTKVSRLVPAHCILASNTSSLSIGKIAAAIDSNRLVGMHFFNPPYILTLLELVHGPQTSEDTLAKARAFAAAMQRDIIVVKDAPGFATSRLGVAIGLEAMRMFEEGVASAADIDRAMELGYKHPMGPLRLSDHVGLDTRLGIAEYLHQELGERFQPPRILRDLVSQGKLGKKSGHGFYQWD